MSRYLIHLSLAVVSIFSAMVAFNWYADPYAIYRTWNEGASRPVVVMNERIFKTVRLARQQADIVILGTSRTDIGIGPQQPALAGKRVHSLASFGQPFHESLRLMQLALQQSKPQLAIVGLDFFAFNGLFPPPSDFTETNFDTSRPYTLMFSVSSTSDAWKAVHKKAPVASDCCYSDGFRTPTNTALLAGSYRRNFTGNERSYLQEKYRPYPSCDYSYASPKGKRENALDEFREMVALAHRQGVELRLFISPSHARQWETLAAAGLWDKWEEWKQLLVRINEEEARKAAHAPFPLWDFSGYHTIASEAVPHEGDKTLMRWYTDSSHFTPAVGELLIDRMFGLQAQGLPRDFGVQLNGANLTAHLANIRAARQRYRDTHAEDVAEVAATAHEVELSKHCPAQP